MMQLSTMKKVVDTVDAEWRSPLAEGILERWGFDHGSVFYYRSSSNFLFVFRKNEKRYFLRFADAKEKDLAQLEAEIDLLLYLQDSYLESVKPVKSNDGNYIEAVEAEMATYYAVVFETVQGKQYEIEELKAEQFFKWGSALGQMHRVLKEVPKELSSKRPSWRDRLNFIDNNLPPQEMAARQEYVRVKAWLECLPVTKENFGLIHYDFELDNQCWDGEKIGILDFDDCANYWFTADIAFALRDLKDFEGEFFHCFMNGYRQETNAEEDIVEQLTWFKRFHDLTLFVKLLKTIDIPISENLPEWLSGLQNKLLRYTENLREKFVWLDKESKR